MFAKLLKVLNIICETPDRVDDSIVIGGNDPHDCHESEGCYVGHIAEVYEEGDDEPSQSGSTISPVSIVR